MGINPIQYRPWKGERTALNLRVYVILRSVFRNGIKSTGVKVLLIFAFLLVYALQFVLMLLTGHESLTAKDMSGNFNAMGLSLFAMLLVAVITSDLVSEDLSNRSFVLYFSRAIRARDYIMGKAGSLVGDRGDIMLPTFFVKLGSGDVYEVHNCMTASDFDGFAGLDVHVGGPMLTVAGTFLQNRVALSYFRDRWNALGVEMEGTPYARALAQARLRGRISAPVCIGVAYYASDAPLSSDLLSEPLGDEGARAVYAVTIAILRNVLGQES